MKEIIAVVRLNKVNQTKLALAEAGFPAFTCRKCLGRGKKLIDLDGVLNELLEGGAIPQNSIGEQLTETTRLIPKRFFTIMVANEEAEKVVNVIMDTNHTGNPGDGKIFILPVAESYNVRSGELVSSK